MEQSDAVKRNLLDAGCSDSSADFVEQLVKAGRLTDALHEMRAIRCGVALNHYSFFILWSYLKW